MLADHPRAVCPWLDDTRGLPVHTDRCTGHDGVVIFEAGAPTESSVGPLVEDVALSCSGAAQYAGATGDRRGVVDGRAVPSSVFATRSWKIFSGKPPVRLGVQSAPPRPRTLQVRASTSSWRKVN